MISGLSKVWLGVAHLYIQVMAEQCYVLCVLSWKRSLLFFGRKWHIKSSDFCSVGSPRLCRMRDPVAGPGTYVKGITDGR